MTRMSEGLVLGCLLSGFSITSIFVLLQIRDYTIEHNESFGNLITQVLDTYKIEISVLIVSIIVALVSAYLFQRKTYNKEKVTLNCTKKVPVEEYEKIKKKTTEEAVKKLIESKPFQEYQAKKKANELKEVELNESDKIVLSDDSDDDGR